MGGLLFPSNSSSCRSDLITLVVNKINLSQSDELCVSACTQHRVDSFPLKLAHLIKKERKNEKENITRTTGDESHDKFLQANERERREEEKKYHEP